MGDTQHIQAQRAATDAEKAGNRKWFDLGARAAAKVWSGLPYGYVCPLCVSNPAAVVFLPEALDHHLLSSEHSPPDSVGGTKVALTCKSCNERAGAGPDSHLANRERALDFAFGTLSQRVPATLEMAGQELHTRVERTGDEFRVLVDKVNNHPVKHKTWSDTLDQLSAQEQPDPLTFRLSLKRRYDAGAAHVSWLRAAYVLAFAVYGYRYCIHPSVRPVLEQLTQPQDEVLPIFCLTTPTAATSLRQIVLVEHPEELRSIAVQMGRHTVFLPALEDNGALYDRLARNVGSNNRFEVGWRGKLIPWPKGPMHQMDLD